MDKKYGDKKDYKKIDFFNSKGGYISTTTWAKNLKIALLHFNDDGIGNYNGASNKITARYQNNY